MKKILVIEDNEKLASELISLLNKYGYEASGVDNFEGVLDQFNSFTPDLVLLDITLPYFDGYHFCREIRQISDVPIIFLTSRSSQADEVMAITLGGDDFITKPYDTGVLLARIASVMKRCYGINQLGEIISVNCVELNVSSNIVKYNDKTVELTKNEQRLLSVLMLNHKKVVSRQRLMDNLWNSNVFVDENTLAVNINRLRAKLGDIGLEDFIATVRGQGYIIK